MPEVYGSAVLWRVLVTLLGALQGAGAPPGILHRPPAAPLAVTTAATDGRFQPTLTAQAYVAVDVESGRILIAHNPRQRRPIASLTKIMTAVLVAERGNLGRRIRVPRAATLVEPNKDDLVSGGRYRRSMLLYSTLLISANDSAYALGFDIGRGSMKRFYDRMNRAAAELGMTDTHYASPNGLEDIRNWSSARDQAILARYALADPVFAKVVATRYKRVKWRAPVHLKEYKNHNRMLFDYPGTYGVKTGYTSKAGACLVVAVRRNGHNVLAVLLGSQNIWEDMPRLLDGALRRRAT
jgi:D-alanyl-D-alanine carboxypeptidase